MDGQLVDRGEAVALVRRLMAGEFGTDAEADAWLERLRRELLCPHVADLVFWSDPQLTPEQVVERALAYRPIAL